MSKKRLTPTEYAALDEDGQNGYYPVYAKWEVKKYRDYQECDMGHEHYLGWAERSIPVGKPIEYRWRQPTPASALQIYYAKQLIGYTKHSIL